MKIAWIGTGVMGSHMARHLASAGHEVYAYNRTYQKAHDLEPEIKAFESLSEVVKDVDVVISMVGYPKDVEDIYEVIFKSAKVGTVFIDMTTSSPEIAARLYLRARALNYQMLDAPVTGGDKGAKEASLSIMVGGDKDVYLRMKSIFDILGKVVTYTGKSGTGQYTKLANQISIAGNILGTVESIVYALDQQLDTDALMKVLSGGSASSWQLINNGSKMLIRDYAPGFYVKHFLKDLDLAMKSSKRRLEGVNLVHKMLTKLVEMKYEDLGTQALILYYLDKQVSHQ